MLSLDKLQSTGKKATRDGFGAGLKAAGDKHDNVIMLTADLRAP